MKKIYKFLLSFLFILILYLLFLNSNSFATDTITFEFNGQIYTWDSLNLPHSDINFLLYKGGENKVNIVYVSSSSRELLYNPSNQRVSWVQQASSDWRYNIYRGYYDLSESSTTNAVYHQETSSSTIIDIYTGSENFIYTNQENIKDLEGNVIFRNKEIINTNSFYCFPEKENVTLDNFKYSQILSVNFSSKNYNNYIAQVSIDGENWFVMSKEYATVDNSAFVFYYDVFENGTYQIRIFDNNTENYIYEGSVEVDNIPFVVTLEPDENTEEPIIAKTNVFHFDTAINYLFDFSMDKQEWKSLNYSNLPPSETEEVYVDDCYYWTRIFKNGIYYFRFTYCDEQYDENGNLVSSTPIYYYVKKEVKNIMVEDYMSDDYIFKPIISLNFNEEKQSFIVRTQSVLLDKALNLNCFYIAYEKTEGFNPNEQIEDSVITGWNKMEIDFENNIYMGTSDAYFYFEIPIINATDTNYKIAFYNYFSKKSSEIVYYDFVYKDAKDYVEKDLKSHLGINVRLNDFLKNIESHFGILGFPMAVVRNFCNKILTLQVKEPIIYIPELYDPFYHNKIYDGTSFNFNSILVNDSVVFIHEFYLTIVDIIFIYLFLVYCVKTLKTFISNITND